MSPLRKKSNTFVKYDHVLITGASGGIGTALARLYAPRASLLTLWGRDTARLKQLAEDCAADGAKIRIVAIDLSKVDVARAHLAEAEAAAPLDLVFLNAGVSDIRQEGHVVESPDSVLETALVNFAVPVTMASSVAADMVRRGKGAIVFSGSVAAWHELPFATAYVASKQGLERFAGALRAAVAPYGVTVTLAALGFVDTRMSQRLRGLKPFLVAPEAVARRISKAVARKHALLVFPGIFRALRIIDALTPRVLVHALLRLIKVNQVPKDKIAS